VRLDGAFAGGTDLRLTSADELEVTFVRFVPDP
jgi:hypothetical protein